MKKNNLFLCLLVTSLPLSTYSSPDNKVPSLKETQAKSTERRVKSTHQPAESEEAVVEDDGDVPIYQYTQAKSTDERDETTHQPAESEEVIVEDDYDDVKAPHYRHKREDTRRRIGIDNDPGTTRGRRLVHDSSHLHEYQLKLEDEIGAGEWAMRWYHDTTKSIFKNVTIELITLANVETKSWVTVCPGHNHIKFRVKTGSDAVVYLADRFYPGDTGAFATNKYNNIINEKEQHTFGNYIQIRIGDGANTPHYDSSRNFIKDVFSNWKSLHSARDQRSYICYNERRQCTNYFAQHIHPLLTNPANPKDHEGQKQRTKDGNRERYLSCDEYRGFWIWWEPSGMVLVGKENKPPFMAYYINKYFKKKWKIRAVGFGEYQNFEADDEAMIAKHACGKARYHINLQFPIHDDPLFEEHSDEIDGQDIDV